MRRLSIWMCCALLSACAQDYAPQSEGQFVLCLFARCELAHDPDDARRDRGYSEREAHDHFD